MSHERLTGLQARRIALAASGFTRRRPEVVTMRHLDAVSQRLGLFQIDSVNVLVRAHHLPLYSRVGAYDEALLHRSYARAPRRLVEFWAHEASLVRVELWPVLGFRMADPRGLWGGPRQVAEEHPDLVGRVLAAIDDLGPRTARELSALVGTDDADRERSAWGWNWSVVKQALEYLFYTGQVTSARRTSSFERVYDLPERVLPAAVLATPRPEPGEAHRRLVEVAARSLGVASEPCLRDYFRTTPQATAQAVGELVEQGVLRPVEVAGWTRPAYLHHEAVRPRRVDARTLLSPFDPLVFERRRTEELFGFRYRLEIYTPAERRVHGYYVLPFLLGDALVARVDLKADRAARVLRVLGSFAEPGSPGETAGELAAELARLAAWLDLDDVVVEPRGDLAPALARAVPG